MTDEFVPSPWKAVLVGLATSITTPLGLAELVVWVALTLATFVYGAYYSGRRLFRGTQHPS